MKKKNYTIIITVFTLLMIACNTNSKEEKVINSYIDALNASDYNKLKTYLNDTITTIEGDYKLSYTIKEYYNWFQWDSVFKPKYKLLEINKNPDSLIVKISKICDRIVFLNNDKLITKQYFVLKNNKISAIKTLSYENTNWETWQENKNNLLNWINKNKIDYPNFINIQNKSAAEQYLEAIRLFRTIKIKN